ncbi:MAG: ATP-binding protein, partial [Proteobacteria bacterium]|nr:ATP-binding protein [Pseudomonadota bacterium]
CRLGGIPEYVKVQQQDYLPALYESIIYRDILARYKLLSDKTLKKLVFYLASHCSKDMSYSSLKKLLGLGSVTTVSDYCGYLENSFLCFFVNRYSESLKAQEQSPKKVYFIDHVLARVVGFRFSEDIGRMLENIVFIELKRRNFDIYYHSENKGCDFILKKMEKIVGAIQVCQNMMDHDTKNREVSGLLEALERYGLKKGTILTESEEGTFSEDYNQKKYEIQVMPVWKFLLSDFQKQ